MVEPVQVAICIIYAYNTYMNVTWDPNKALLNYKDHGIRFDDAESVLYDPSAKTMEDYDSEGERRYVSIGRDALDRILVVCFAESDDYLPRLISARKADKSEVKQYER